MSAVSQHIPTDAHHNPSHSNVSAQSLIPKGYKRRASKACSFCQWRKIRCNVEVCHPCSNCVLEKVECSITKTRKTKKPKVNHDTSMATSLPLVAQATAVTHPEIPKPANHQAEHSDVAPDTATIDQHDTLAVNDRKSLDALGRSGMPRESAEMVSVPSLGLSPSLSLAPSSSLHEMGNTTTLTSQAIQVVLPDFIQPIPSHLAPEDIEYLHKKGCFDIPAPELRDAILRCYAEYVHPTMPLLDLARFLSSITSAQPQRERVSLLLYQAVMFAGSAHVDIKPLRKLGFLTRKAARKALYLKTKALYDLDYEQNRLCVVRALSIAMSFWIETMDDQKDGCHWVQIAWSLSRRAGLDRDPAKMSMSEPERRLRRRLYWSLLSRDALGALGLKAPLNCWPQTNEISDLVVDDFDLGDVPQDGYDKIGVLWPPGKRRLLCLVCVSQTKLHQHLRSILCKQYRFGDYKRNAGKGDETSSKISLLPLTTADARANLDELEAGLNSWRDSLPAELQQTAVGPEISDADFEPFVVHRSMLHMLYHTCLITLYRPWLHPYQGLTSIQTVSSEDTFQQRAQTTVRDSAYAITDHAVELYQLDLVRHLPQTGLSALVAAVVSHIADMLSPWESLRQAGFRGFERCSHLINELRENYYSADFTADFARILAQAKQLPNPPKFNHGTSHSKPGVDAIDFRVEAQSGFSGIVYDHGDGTIEQASSPLLAPPLPTALLPEGFDLSTPERTDLTENANWSLPIEFNETFGHDPTNLALTGVEDYYRNFREETVRLLGDFYDDNTGLFSIRPGIDAVLT